jgi:Mg-chelatase subunit ChlD
VLAALLMVVILGLVAFAVDIGYIVLVRTELQAAADSAALAGAANMANPADAIEMAKRFAAQNTAGRRNVQLADADIEFGVWDANTRVFTKSGDQSGNALRVTTRRNDLTGGNALFFARIFGLRSFDVSASAVALGNPRDICLVVDLSGSMNDDTEPGYSGTGQFSGLYAAIRTQMMQEVFDDFNFGPYPGAQQAVGEPLGVNTYSAMIANNGPLTKSTYTYKGVTYPIPSQYRISNNDSAATKKWKAYSWMMDYQLAPLMPQARPVPNSGNTASYNYWTAYLDVVTGQSSGSQNLGYRTYVQFMMDNGREKRPNGTDYTQLSVSSPNCPFHAEEVGSGRFLFPPREQPTHACRRSLIAAIQEIKQRNDIVYDANQRDWVSIVTFDRVAGTTVHFPLSGNYDAAMQACTRLQAVSDDGSSTATETGLIAAYNHIKARSEGGQGRQNTQKVVVLLTDGMPNLRSSSNSTISNYISRNPSSNFYGSSSYYNHDAALMQASIMRRAYWKVFAVGIGLGTDNGFMDRMARMGGTANDNGQAPRTSGDPREYENELRKIFKQIVDTPQVRLVQ